MTTLLLVILFIAVSAISFQIGLFIGAILGFEDDLEETKKLFKK